MRVRIPIASIGLCALLIASSSARAENDFGRTGLYLRGGVAAAFDASNVLLLDETDAGWGLGLAAGYRFHKNFALEGLYQWLGESKIFGIPAVKRWDATANLRISTSGRFQPYAVVGIGYGHYELINQYDLGGFVARFGVGLEIYIVKFLAIYGEGAYMLTTGDIDELPYATFGAGAVFRF